MHNGNMKVMRIDVISNFCLVAAALPVMTMACDVMPLTNVNRQWKPELSCMVN